MPKYKVEYGGKSLVLEGDHPPSEEELTNIFTQVYGEELFQEELPAEELPAEELPAEELPPPEEAAVEGVPVEEGVAEEQVEPRGDIVSQMTRKEYGTMKQLGTFVAARTPYQDTDNKRVYEQIVSAMSPLPTLDKQIYRDPLNQKIHDQVNVVLGAEKPPPPEEEPSLAQREDINRYIVRGYDEKTATNIAEDHALGRARLKAGETKSYEISRQDHLKGNYSSIPLDQLQPGDEIVEIIHGNTKVHKALRNRYDIEDIKQQAKLNEVKQALIDDPLIVNIPLIGRTPVKAVLDDLGYQIANLFTVGGAKRRIDKPPLTELLDKNVSETPFSEDNPQMQVARIFRGAGETAGGIFQILGALLAAGYLGFSAAVTGALGFGGLGAIRRLADPDIAKDLDPVSFVVGTGFDAMLGAAFPWMTRVGGEVIREPSTIKAFGKYLFQTGVLSTGITANEFADNYIIELRKNPDKPAMQTLIDIGDQLNWVQFAKTYMMMSLLHAAGTYTRFMPAKGGKVKTTEIVEYGEGVKGKFNAEWYRGLSGKQKAEILNRQFKWAQENYHNFTDYNPKTGAYKPIKKPNTLRGAQELIQREVEWISRLMHGKEIPIEGMSGAKAAAPKPEALVKAEKPPVTAEKPVEAKPAKAKPEKPTEPEFKPAELDKVYTKQEMIDVGAGGLLSNAKVMEIPIKDIEGLEPIPEPKSYVKGREITQPIEVVYEKDMGKYVLYAGNHRVQQAKVNGQKTITAFVEGYEAVKPVIPEAKFKPEKKITGYRSEEVYGEGYRGIDEVVKHEIDELGNKDIIETLVDRNIIKDESELPAYIKSLKDRGYDEVMWLSPTKKDVIEQYDVSPESVEKYDIKDGVVLSDLGKEGQLIAYKPKVAKPAEKKPPESPPKYILDVSKEAMDYELWSAQGERQKFVGAEGKEADLFGDYNHPKTYKLDDIRGTTKESLTTFFKNRKTLPAVDEMIKKIRSGEPLPPIVIEPTKRGWDLVGGRHRVLAARELGIDQLPAVEMYWRDLGLPKGTPRLKPVKEKPTGVTEGAQADRTLKLNERYNIAQQAQLAAEMNLKREDLPEKRKELYEQSFEKATTLLADVEAEAKAEKVTLARKPTETDAIKEVVDLFKEVDPKVDYKVRLDEARTAQDAINDPRDPATPESVALAIQEAGEEFLGVEPAEISIAGQNYQEIRDGALVDIIKIHRGSDMGTVIHERSETWYRQQEEMNKEWDKIITAERRKYYERTGEKDDPAQSNREWFSDRAMDNAVGAKPVGKVSAALQRIFNKFKEYAEALKKSANRFGRYVKEGKVPSKLKSFLDQAIEKPIKTPEQVAKALKKPKKVEGEIALEPKVRQYSIDLKKKGRTHKELEKTITKSDRVAREKPKGKPMRHISGKKFKDLDNLNKTESKVSLEQGQIDAIWADALESTGLTSKDFPLSPNADLWNRAFKLPDEARYWYEISAEGFAEKFPELSPVELQTVLAVTSAASVLAKPDFQLARTISILSEIERGLPIMTGVPTPRAVTNALYRSLEGLKTGNFEQTFSYILGFVDKPPLTTNDRQVAKYMNVSEKVLRDNPRLYEAISKFHIGIRDVVNAQLPKNINPYESHQLQALPWTQLRIDRGISKKPDNMLEAIDTNLKRLKKGGVDVPVNTNGEMYISKELLKDPKVVETLSPTVEKIKTTKIATVEVGTLLTEEGRVAKGTYDRMSEIIEKADDPRIKSRLKKAQNEYNSILIRNLGKISKPNKNLGNKSIINTIVSSITGKAAGITRIEYGIDTYGTFEGIANPNIRIPMTTSFGDPHIKLTNEQIDQLLAELGSDLNQAAMAASLFKAVKPSASPDTRSVFLPTEKRLSMEDAIKIENVLNSETGKLFSFNVSHAPNGVLIDINPHFNKDYSTTAPEALDIYNAVESVMGDKINIKLFENTYNSNYIEASQYNKIRKGARRGIEKKYIDPIVLLTGGGKRKISKIIKGKESIREAFPESKKYDIKRIRAARNRYRREIGSLDRSSQESQKIAQSVNKELSDWGGKHTPYLEKVDQPKPPKYEFKRRDKKLKGEPTSPAEKTPQEIFKSLRSIDKKTSELPEYARSINLEKQAISDALKRMEVNLGKISAKQVQTWDETGRIRDEILSDYGKAIKVLKKAKRHGIVNAAEMDAIRQINVNAIHRLKEMVETETPKEAINEYEQYYEDIFNITSDVSSEIGRALNIHKRTVSENRMARAFSQLTRGMNKRELAEFKKLNFENPLEVERFIRRLGDPTLMNYVYEFWYNSILSGIPTHMVNIASNTGWGLFQIPVRGLVGGIDKVVTMFTGKQRQRYIREMVPMMGGYRSGFGKGGRRFWKTMKTGEPPMDIDTKWEIEMGRNLSAFERSPYKPLRKMAPYLTAPTRALRGMDVWANSIAFDAQINALAKRKALQEGLKGEKRKERERSLRENPTNAMIEEAKTFAKYNTFMDDPGEFTSWIMRGRDKVWGGRLIIPFVNTISNLFKRGVEMTPGVGLVRGKEYYKGQPAAKIMAKQLIGTVLALYIYSKFEDDEIIGEAPKSKSKREAFYRQGKKAWSIKFGDKWYQYRRVEPFNTVIASVAIALNELKQTEDEERGAEIFSRTAEGIANNLIDSSYLQGVTNLLDRYGRREGMFERLGASFVPYSGFWRSINRSLEALTEGEAKYRPAKEFFDAITQVIPGLSKKSPAEINVWGEEITLEGGVLRQWLPYKWSEETKDPLELEMQRVGMYPALPGKRVTINGVDVEFPDDFYREYAIHYGQAAKKMLEQYIDFGSKQDPVAAARYYDKKLSSLRRGELKLAKSAYIREYGLPKR